MNFFDIVFSAIFIFFIYGAVKNGPSRGLIISVFVTVGYITADSLYMQYFEILLPYTGLIGTAKVFVYLTLFFGMISIGIFLKRTFSRYSKSYNSNSIKTIFSSLLGLYNGLIFFLVIYFLVGGFILSFKDDLDSSYYVLFYHELYAFIDGIKLA